MSENNPLEIVFKNAKEVSLDKLLLATHFSNGNKTTELASLKVELEEVFVILEEPTFSDTFSTTDSTAIDDHIIIINLLNPRELDICLEKIVAFLEFIRSNILSSTIVLANNQPSDWNLRTLNALQKMNRKIAGRKRFFLRQDPSVISNPDYKKATTTHKELKKTYRDALKDNRIQSDAADVNVLNNFTAVLPIIQVLVDFINQMEQINQFIEGELPVA